MSKYDTCMSVVSLVPIGALYVTIHHCFFSFQSARATVSQQSLGTTTTVSLHASKSNSHNSRNKQRNQQTNATIFTCQSVPTSLDVLVVFFSLRILSKFKVWICRPGLPDQLCRPPYCSSSGRNWRVDLMGILPGLARDPFVK